jgi:carboxymethylenebutenolidase
MLPRRGRLNGEEIGMVSERNVEVTTKNRETLDCFLAIPEAGRGPGIVLLQEIFGVNEAMRSTARMLAEEGYTVLVPDLFWRFDRNIQLTYGEEDLARAFDYYQRFDSELAISDIDATIHCLRSLAESDGQAAVVGFCLGGTLALLCGTQLAPDAVAAFYPVAIQDLPVEATAVTCPTVIHFGAEDPMCPPDAATVIRERFSASAHVKVHSYPSAGHAFFNPERPEFDPLASEAALTHTLELIRPLMGPHYDLVALWEQHAYFEFGLRDADKTIETMVEVPYVNHVPSMTGGTGCEELRHFYKNYFVDVHPEDYSIVSVSRTVGVNRIVDEMVVSFTHDRMIDYLMPGIQPTGKKIKIAACGVISFRGSKLRHEHLYYDLSSILVQAGVIDPDHYPVVGVEQALKVLDPHSYPSNDIMKTWHPAK